MNVIYVTYGECFMIETCIVTDIYKNVTTECSSVNKKSKQICWNWEQ